MNLPSKSNSDRTESTTPPPVPGCPSRADTAVYTRINPEKGIKLEAELSTTKQFSDPSQTKA